MIHGCKIGNFWKDQVLVYATGLMTDIADGSKRHILEHYMNSS